MWISLLGGDDIKKNTDMLKENILTTVDLKNKNKQKLIYKLLVLKKLNNFLHTIISNGAHLKAGFTILCKVSKNTLCHFISLITHHIVDIMTNVFIKTYSHWGLLQLSLYDHLNPYSISWDTKIKIEKFY